MHDQTPTRYDACIAEFNASLLGTARRTGGRFNLVRPAALRRQTFARDIIASSPGQQGAEAVRSRFLVIDAEAVNFNDYQRLADCAVPQLHLLNASENLAVFEIPSGAKQLQYESTYDRRSTATYIGDQEIYAEAGRIYAAAWRATGKVMIDESDANPAAHLAITNFTNERGEFLYLCPPYSGLEAGTHDQAREIFVNAIVANLPAQTQPFANELIGAAAAGFDDIRYPEVA